MSQSLHPLCTHITSESKSKLARFLARFPADFEFDIDAVALHEDDCCDGRMFFFIERDWMEGAIDVLPTER